jgi:hypothetical protein
MAEGHLAVCQEADVPGVREPPVESGTPEDASPGACAAGSEEVMAFDLEELALRSGAPEDCADAALAAPIRASKSVVAERSFIFALTEKAGKHTGIKQGVHHTATSAITGARFRSNAREEALNGT